MKARWAMREAAMVRKDLALLPPRLAIGAAMVYHGIDKLREGHREQVAQSFEDLGIRPGRHWARATGIAEAAAGAMSVLGVLTRPAAVAMLVTQVVAIAKVHAPKGYPVMKGGYEYNLALMAIAAELLIAGPGRFSVHEAIEHVVQGTSPGRRTFASRLVRLLK